MPSTASADCAAPNAPWWRRLGQWLLRWSRAPAEPAWPEVSVLPPAAWIDDDPSDGPGAAWCQRLQCTLDHARRQAGYPFAVLALQLDGVQAALQDLPPSAGRELLDEVQRRLQQNLRPGDGISSATLQADAVRVFAVVEDRGAVAPWAAQLQPLLAEMGEPYTVAFHPVRLQAHLALVDHRQAPADSAGLLQALMPLLQHAVRSGSAQPLVLDPALQQQQALEQAHQAEVQQAVARQEWQLELTPVLALADGRVLVQHAELAWLHPQRGRLLATDFFPEGMGPGQGAWLAVGAEAVRLALRACRQGPVSLALPLPLCECGEFVATLAQALAQAADEAGVEPGRLELRVPEAALREGSAAAAVLPALQAQGVRIAAQGLTGALSLSVLARWPLSSVVIDSPIVAALPDGEPQRVLVQGLVGLAQMLRLQVVAAGVHTPAQRQCLLQLGVELGRGPAATAAATSTQQEALAA